jgi:hypothetical protein
MQVSATIRPNSEVHHLWRKQNRTFGVLGNNRFVWKGISYESQEITDIDFLVNHRDVIVEIIGRPSPKAEPVITAPKPRGRPAFANMPAEPPTSMAASKKDTGPVNV